MDSTVREETHLCLHSTDIFQMCITDEVDTPFFDAGIDEIITHRRTRKIPVLVPEDEDPAPRNTRDLQTTHYKRITRKWLARWTAMDNARKTGTY